MNCSVRGPDIAADLREFLVHYEEGKRLYYGRDWQGAARHSSQHCACVPMITDAPASAAHRGIYANTTPDNWNGVFVMQSK